MAYFAYINDDRASLAIALPLLGPIHKHPLLKSMNIISPIKVSNLSHLVSVSPKITAYIKFSRWLGAVLWSPVFICSMYYRIIDFWSLLHFVIPIVFIRRSAWYGNIGLYVGTNLHMSIFAFLDDRLRPKIPFPSISTDQHLDKQTAGLAGHGCQTDDNQICSLNASVAFQFTTIAAFQASVSLFNRAEAVFKFCMGLVRLFVYSPESGVKRIIYDRHGSFGRQERQYCRAKPTYSDNKR